MAGIYRYTPGGSYSTENFSSLPSTTNATSGLSANRPIFFIGGFQEFFGGPDGQIVVIATNSQHTDYVGSYTGISSVEGGFYFDFSSYGADSGYSAQFFGGGYGDILRGGGGGDALYGGDGADTLDGGVGADQLTGGLGNDTYTVDNIGDLVTELAGEGTDTVQSSISWWLGANVENVTFSGSADLDGLGNELDNVMIGNDGSNYLKGESGNDTLYGGGGDDRLQGGFGDDSMVGGAGNDVYYVDSFGDMIVESADEGTDTVYASFDYTLGSELERLKGVGSTGLFLQGNDLDNSIVGTSGGDTLNGGIGRDVLSGGGGEDTFYILRPEHAGDSITDFDVGEDTLWINSYYFDVWTLDEGAFESNARGMATTEDARFIYAENSGRLFFDADGSGVGEALLLATLRGAPDLTAADLLVYSPPA